MITPPIELLGVGPARRQRTPTQLQQSAPHAALLMTKPAGDPFWANVQILAPFNTGTNNGLVTFTTPNIGPITGASTTGGSASTYCSISAAQVKYGAGALSYPASGNPSTYFGPSGGMNFNVGTGAFTEEIWYYPATTSVQQQIIDAIPGGNTAGYLIVSQSSGGLVFYGAGAIRITAATGVLTVNTWHHIAVSRASGTTRMFVNGTQVGSSYTDSNNYSPTAGNRVIGNYWNASDAAKGSFFDDYRLTVGVGRYTSNFTAPSAPFPNF